MEDIRQVDPFHFHAQMEALGALVSRLREAVVLEDSSMVDRALKLVGDLFPNLIEKSLHIIDQRKVHHYRIVQGRSFFRVKGSTDEVYLVIGNNFCSCRYFQERVVSQQLDFMCKHVLAVIVAHASNSCAETITLSSEDFSTALADALETCLYKETS
ncbi:hypothetical protein IE077_001359 [Cardiosporidium cionae]|uniref:SWIM-type domain-containing protein n=1 Tax=Cardiosporidium cionae TaxID=476202 RepID=A0ABQ7J5I4_9APIC|nr:hypothetical protein IE077_001359 [Cardiosporidium cionae]|eukprot:KAF8819234.1 hypothetical protein IE077_001359 [Cardiosporidium cionae]